MFRKWLQVCPDASWSDVVRALKKARENKLAEEIESQYVTKRNTLVTTSGIESLKYAEHTSTPEDDDAYHSPEAETQDTTAEYQRIQGSLLHHVPSGQ